MKFIIIPYISLGLILSLFFGVGYHCSGLEMFPDYYGSPFVFKKKSLGSSMEYFYSISGLILNVLFWSSLLFLINTVIVRIISKSALLYLLYKMIISVMIAFTTLIILVDSVTIGGGFGKGRNYWYWNIDKEAKEWNMTCQGELIMFRK